MDLELPELLKQVYSSEPHPLRAALQRLLAPADRIPGVPAGGLTAGDAAAARLLWLSAHYLSAAATSHGLQLAYVQGGAERGGLAPRLGALAHALPSKLVLTVIRHGEPAWQRHSCGGEQSDFEKRDLGFLEHDPRSDQRLGALVVRWGAGDDGAFLDALIAAQRLVAFILVLRPADTPGPALPSLGDGWSLDQLGALPGGVALDVHYNLGWEADIHAAADLRYTDPAAGDAPAAPEMALPMVRAGDFGGASVLEYVPSETLAGPEIAVYSLNAQGSVTASSGRLGAMQTQERTVYALDDVNVSHIGTVWRSDRVLYESLLFQGHDSRWIRGTAAVVSEPTRTLEGTYFLAPTGNTHHSHLMWETLRRLNVADKHGPAGILASSVLSASQRDYFPHFGFPPDRIVFKRPGETVRVERLIVTAEEAQRYDRASVDYLRRIAAAHYERPTDRPTRLYLSRSDSRVNRNMVNEEEIEAIFAEYGFTTIVASALSAREKIALFSTAEVIGGPLGAAFTYLPFALDASAIMLTTEQYFPPVYLETAAVQQSRIDLVRGIGLKAYTDAWGYEHTSFHMPPEMVRAVLDLRLTRG